MPPNTTVTAKHASTVKHATQLCYQCWFSVYTYTLKDSQACLATQLCYQCWFFAYTCTYKNSHACLQHNCATKSNQCWFFVYTDTYKDGLFHSITLNIQLAVRTSVTHSCWRCLQTLYRICPLFKAKMALTLNYKKTQQSSLSEDYEAPYGGS